MTDWKSYESTRITIDELYAKHLEAMRAGMLASLNRDLFADGANLPVRPLTWRERLVLRWSRVRSYGSTLWLALKGVDPYDSDW